MGIILNCELTKDTKLTKEGLKDFFVKLRGLVGLISKLFSNAPRKNDARCQPSMYLYGVSPVV